MSNLKNSRSKMRSSVSKGEPKNSEIAWKSNLVFPVIVVVLFLLAIIVRHWKIDFIVLHMSMDVINLFLF